MNRQDLKQAINNGNIEWQRHALERMMERGISRTNVKEVLLGGVIIEAYKDDKPFPSALFLGWIEEKPLHAVAAYDAGVGHCYVITAYKPDLEHFESDFRTRRRHGN